VSSPASADPSRALALAIRDVCRAEMVRAWEDALSSGLCNEGAFEVAVGALARLDADELLRRVRDSGAGPASPPAGRP
jgi:hypothetical protein